MGVPARLAAEYPRRCLQLIEALESVAREEQLVGSFALLAAASVLTIPFERARSKHFLHRDHDDDLTAAVEALGKVKFSRAPFWEGDAPVGWRQSHIVQNVDSVAAWIDRDGRHPLDSGAQNFIEGKTSTEVIRVIRNALAHGNIIYLNESGEEKEGDRLFYLAFLSRYEEGRDAQEEAETYRLIVTPEAEFLRFVKKWASWISDAALQDRRMQAA
jgi:hypothetical protein